MKPQDRQALIRLASALPKGSEERRAILTGLQKQGADDSWTGMVEVEALTDEDALDREDADMLRDAPYGPYTVKARHRSDAMEVILDKFHDEVPISILGDFDIEVKRLKKASKKESLQDLDWEEASTDWGPFS